MRKIVLTAIGATVIAGMLAGCAPGRNTPGATLVGAGIGGVAGGAIFRGPGGVIGGALIGGVLGNLVGQRMDRRDEMYMSNAIMMERPVEWTNARTHTTYRVSDVKRYHRGNCRRYTVHVMMEGRDRVAHGRACRTAEGTWRVVR